MKYLFIFFSIIVLSCSPKISPDFGWNRGRWVVVELKGVPVQQSGGRRDAYISFDIGEKRFSGNGGCNQITGNYSVSRNSIRFTDVVSTKMSCNDIEFENTFLSELNTIDRYEVRGTDILLKRRKTTVIVLRQQ